MAFLVSRCTVIRNKTRRKEHVPYTLFFLPDRFQTGGRGEGGGGEKRNEKCSLSLLVAMHPFSLLSFFSFFHGRKIGRVQFFFFFFSTITSFLSRIKDGEVFSSSFLSVLKKERNNFLIHENNFGCFEKEHFAR